MTGDSKKESSRKVIQWDPKRSVMTGVQKDEGTNWEPENTVMRTVKLTKGREGEKETRRSQEKQE